MNEQTDGRLLPWHKERLSHATLIYHQWYKTDANDHDHCAFCWDKFAEFDGCLHIGYSTENRFYWICETCFADFKEMFQWRVQDHTVQQ